MRFNCVMLIATCHSQDFSLIIDFQIYRDVDNDAPYVPWIIKWLGFLQKIGNMCWFMSSTVDLGQGLSFILWLFLGITIDYSSVIPFIIVSPIFIMVPLGNSSSFLTLFLSLLLFIILLMNILDPSFFFALTDYWLWNAL